MAKHIIHRAVDEKTYKIGDYAVYAGTGYCGHGYSHMCYASDGDRWRQKIYPISEYRRDEAEADFEMELEEAVRHQVLN